MEEKKPSAGIILITLALILDLFLWYQIAFGQSSEETQLHFLNVGQGDSSLIILAGNIKVMVDAGPGSKVLGEVESSLSPGEKYIDLALISHPQLDHFGGFRTLLERYRFGAFIINGRESDSVEWQELISKIEKEGIPIITLAAGDKILHTESRITFFSPSPSVIQSAELNDTSFVNLFESRGLKVLFTGDSGENIENFLVNQYPERKLSAHILKVGHHGSKFATTANFLNAVGPKIAVIGVGENRFGHPAKETLLRLDEAGVQKIFRTDQDGRIVFKINKDNKIQVFKGS